MNFSKTTEYALRILSHMAKDEKKLYTTKEIFEDLTIPFRYLRKQMTILTKSGLIESIQGKYGGYKISRNLNQITLLDIVNATGEMDKENECFFGYTDCAAIKKCAMHDKWNVIKQNIKEVLASTTLTEIKENSN